MAKFISTKCTHKCNKRYVIYFIPYFDFSSIRNLILGRLFPNFRTKNLEFELQIEIDHFQQYQVILDRMCQKLVQVKNLELKNLNLCWIVKTKFSYVTFISFFCCEQLKVKFKKILFVIMRCFTICFKEVLLMLRDLRT